MFVGVLLFVVFFVGTSLFNFMHVLTLPLISPLTTLKKLTQRVVVALVFAELTTGDHMLFCVDGREDKINIRMER